jgi:hypothetical protein
MPFPAIAAAVEKAAEAVFEFIKDTCCATSAVSNQNAKKIAEQNTINNGSVSVTFIAPPYMHSK